MTWFARRKPAFDPIVHIEPTADNLLRAALAEAEDNLAVADGIIAYQQARMREMAAQILAGQPPTADGVQPHECPHPTVGHGQWGCTVDGCECAIPRHLLDKEMGRVGT